MSLTGPKPRPPLTGHVLPPMSEGAFQAQIVEYCDWLRLLVFHDNDSRRNRAGFPDLTIVGRRLLFVELKSEKGKLRPEQHVWIDRLRSAIGDDAVHVWRPSDWPRAQQVLQELR